MAGADDIDTSLEEVRKADVEIVIVGVETDNSFIGGRGKLSPLQGKPKKVFAPSNGPRIKTRKGKFKRW